MDISKIAVNGVEYAIKDTVTSINGKSGAIEALDIASVLTTAGYKLTDTVTSINGKTAAIAAQDIASVLIADGYKLTDNNTTYQFSQSGNTLQMGTDGGAKSDIYTPTRPSYNLDEVSDGSTRKLSNYLPLSGGTITGELNRKCTNVDASKADNNISSTIWPTTFNVTDNNDRILTRKEAVIDPNGNISAYWYVRNYNTSGAQVGQKGIRITMDKSGNTTYTVDQAANFRSAIGAGTSSFSGDYNDLSNKPSSMPASDVSAWAKASTKPTYIANEVMSISVEGISGNTSSSCSITGSGNAGKAQTIIYTNSGSADYTVTVPTTYSTPDGAAIELTCKAGGYCEVSYLNIGGTIYARGL